MFGSGGTGQEGVEGNGDGGIRGLSAEVAHSLPGRLRLRISELKQHPEIAIQLQHGLGSLEQLQSMEVNARAGSVVLQYDPAVQEKFAASIRSFFPNLNESPRSDRGGGAGSHQARERHDLADEIADLFGQVNKNVEQATGGLDLNVLVPMVLLACALLGVMIGAFRPRRMPMPNWYDLLWFAFNTFVILNLTWRGLEPGTDRRSVAS